MSTRLHTADPLHQLSNVTNTRRRAIRAIMLECLTEIMYRRVALLYGFDGPAMTERKAASVEGCSRGSLRESRDTAFARMTGDWRLWTLWLLYGFGKFSDPPGSYKGEAWGEAYEAWTAHPTGHAIEQEMQEMAERGFERLDLYPGMNGWESDRYTPRSRYDREIDAAIVNGEIGLRRVFTERRMLLAARDAERNAKGDPDEYDREITRALFEREAGRLDQEEFDRRTLLALRAYVTG